MVIGLCLAAAALALALPRTAVSEEAVAGIDDHTERNKMTTSNEPESGIVERGTAQGSEPGPEHKRLGVFIGSAKAKVPAVLPHSVRRQDPPTVSRPPLTRGRKGTRFDKHFAAVPAVQAAAY